MELERFVVYDLHGNPIGITLIKDDLRKDKIIMGPKHPNVNVQLVGEDGNAFSILGRVKAALRKAGISKNEQDAFLDEAMSGDYDHLLQTVMGWVNTDSAEEASDSQDMEGELDEISSHWDEPISTDEQDE